MYATSNLFIATNVAPSVFIPMQKQVIHHCTQFLSIMLTNWLATFNLTSYIVLHCQNFVICCVQPHTMQAYNSHKGLMHYYQPPHGTAT